MLIWVASYPRSGNTLSLLALRDVFGIGALGADFQDDFSLGRISRRALPGDFRPWRAPADLEELEGAALLDALRERPEPYFIKTHRLERATDPAPALYLVRDGRDALVSHAHLVKENDVPAYRNLDFDGRLAALIDPGIRAQGGWSGNVRAWRARSAPTSTIRFEDLILDPSEAVSRACAQLGVHLPPPGRGSLAFDHLHELSPRTFRRGVVGSWRDEMAPPLHALFWRFHRQEMTALGYGGATAIERAQC